jgi:hypothetical protein
MDGDPDTAVFDRFELQAHDGMCPNFAGGAGIASFDVRADGRTGELLPCPEGASYRVLVLLQQPDDRITYVGELPAGGFDDDPRQITLDPSITPSVVRFATRGSERVVNVASDSWPTAVYACDVGCRAVFAHKGVVVSVSAHGTFAPVFERIVYQTLALIKESEAPVHG